MNETRRSRVAVPAPTLIDRVVGYIDPVAGARRMHARTVMALAGGYAGGKRSRRATQGWQTTLAGSADSDLLPDLAVLRDRARDLVRNAPLAGGAVNTVVSNVVGTGLMLQAQIDRAVLGLTADAAAQWQKGAEREWRLWCSSPECDITRTQNFYELQDLVFRATLESGDVFTLLPYVRRPGQAYGLKLQVIEADRVCNPKFQIDKLPFVGGVELEATGAPVAYHILRTHPGDLLGGREWDRYLAFGPNTGRRAVLHLFRRLRPGQNRGVPYLAPVIETLKQLDRYTEAEIMAAVVSGLFTVFVHSEGPGLDLANQQGMGKETGAAAGDTDAKLANGAIIDLGPNEKIETADPGRPNTAFDPFVLAILRQVGVALELPFEVLVKHFTASYSAARAALLEAWRFYRVRRSWLADKFCQPVYETWLAEAVASGRVVAPGFFADPLVRAAWCGAAWNGDGPGSIQPLLEMEAAEKRIELGVSSLQAEVAEYNGRDWEAVHEQRAREKAARVSAGLEAPANATAPASAPKGTPAGTIPKQPDPALDQPEPV